MNSLPTYEVFALRYARVDRSRHENFIDCHHDHDHAMPMDYFVWLIKGEVDSILVDTGFNQQAADKRGRALLHCPIDTLRCLGVNPDELQDVIITHLHYDHAGNMDLLPKARFHIQDDEVSFATGRCMLHRPLRHSYNVEDVVHLIRSVYQNRVVFHDGDYELVPGIQVFKIGGHTAGLQVVRIHTSRGWVVLASDASHFYSNMLDDSPFPIVFNVGDMLDGYRTLSRLADSADHLIPGHDPVVRRRFPAYESESADIVCLHLPPITALDKSELRDGIA
ncbi:Metallo-beta-lactamase superfamily protein [compost metagenome]